MKKFKRRVQLTGKSTYIISLPKEWTSTVGLNKGDEVILEILPDLALRLYPIKEGVTIKLCKNVDLKLNNFETAIIETISAYLAGYDKIKVKTQANNAIINKKLIETIKNKIIGLEILEETSDSINMYSILDDASILLLDVLKKLVVTVNSMLDDIEVVLSDPKNKEVIMNIVARDNIVDKLFLFALRNLNQILTGRVPLSNTPMKNLSEALYLTIGLKGIERIADHTEVIAKHILENDGLNIPTELIDVYKSVKELTKKALNAFISVNKNVASEVLQRILQLKPKEISFTLGNLDIHDALRLQFILESIKRIIAYTIDIIEATIDIATSREYNESLKL